VPDPADQRLLDLYKLAIEEYRFQVKLNWDRTAFHLTLNSGLLAIAVGLLKLGSAPMLNLFVAGVFLISLMAAVIGLRTIRKGHQYYRNTVVKKTLLEDQLGLTKPVEGYLSLTQSISTTIGQSEQFEILHNTEKWLKRPLRESITWWILFILVLFAIADAAGVTASIFLYLHPPSNPHSHPSNSVFFVKSITE
jgi:hypothetical protein